MTEEQNRVGLPVEHAVPMLADMLTQLLQDMRVRAQLETSMSDRIAITGDSHVQLGLLLQEARIGCTLYFRGLSSCGRKSRWV